MGRGTWFVWRQWDVLCSTCSWTDVSLEASPELWPASAAPRFLCRLVVHVGEQEAVEECTLSLAVFVGQETGLLPQTEVGLAVGLDRAASSPHVLLGCQRTRGKLDTGPVPSCRMPTWGGPTLEGPGPRLSPTQLSSEQLQPRLCLGVRRGVCAAGHGSSTRRLAWLSAAGPKASDTLWPSLPLTLCTGLWGWAWLSLCS